VEAGIEAVCRHVKDQTCAFAGRPVEHVPEQNGMTDLLIGAYIWGLLDGYLHASHAGPERAGDTNIEATILAVADPVFCRLFGQERARWVRTHLPQWNGPPAQHPIFKRALEEMRHRGASDSHYLAAGDPLLFARAGSLLAFLMQTMPPRH
jgi:hypothetical protein